MKPTIIFQINLPNIKPFLIIKKIIIIQNNLLLKF
jgi:hypothetical protein